MAAVVVVLFVPAVHLVDPLLLMLVVFNVHEMFWLVKGVCAWRQASDETADRQKTWYASQVPSQLGALDTGHSMNWILEIYLKNIP